MNGDMDMELEASVPRRPRRRSLPLEDDDEMTEIGRRGLNAFNRLVDLRNKGLQTPYAQEIVDEGRYNIGRAWDELNRQYEASGGASSSGPVDAGPPREGAGRQRRNSFDTIAGDLTMAGLAWSQQSQDPEQPWPQDQPTQQQQSQQWQQQQQWQEQQQQQQPRHIQQHQYGGELEGSPTQQGSYFGAGKRRREGDECLEFTSPQRIKHRRNSNSFSQLSPLFQREPPQFTPVEGFLPATFGMRSGTFPQQQSSSMQH